jgi:hypothetical protein
LALLEFSPLMALMAQEAVAKVDNMAHLLGAGQRKRTRTFLYQHNTGRQERREALLEAAEQESAERAAADKRHQRIQTRVRARMEELRKTRTNSSKQEAEKVVFISTQIAELQDQLKKIEATTFVAKHETNKSADRLRAKIQALEAESMKCEQEAARLLTDDGIALALAQVVREELENEASFEEEVRNLPHWRVIETCTVRAALDLCSDHRSELHPGDEIVELDQGIVDDELQIRIETGWVAAESLEKQLDESENAQDEHAKRLFEAMDKVKLQELQVRTLCRSQQMMSWALGQHSRLGQHSPAALLVRCNS